ncbi:N-acetylmuramoyl-L-alanine amidase [Streptomyces sp. NPDC085614]|uniref:peptidoglycan recognition protein family protein n=1 Tax=Streptomyces sp. NPDC085614 TaxID=3365733 RepID=UPI0037D3D8CE
MIPHLLRRAARASAASAFVLASVGLTTPGHAADAPVPGAPDTAAGTGVRGISLTGGGPALRQLSARPTAPFSMVGLTWADSRARLDGTTEVRTRDRLTGVWSAWRALETDVRTPEVGAGAGGSAPRAGTQPLWAGPSDGVQVRVTARPGARAPLPGGLRLELVDPAVVPAASGAPTAPASGTSGTAAPRPAVTPRSGWGADESLVADPPRYSAETKAVFVHHTAGSNDYACAESPDIIRAIFLYHVRSQGWNDIGYQFLVDKCGTVFEGRAGGTDQPVVGAQTYGFNTDTTGVAVLGNYNDAVSSPVLRDAIAAVAAWKLGLYGHDAAGTAELTAAADSGLFEKGQKVVLNRISGHRDGYPTECPGDNLYADLPTIRRLAAVAQAG